MFGIGNNRGIEECTTAKHEYVVTVRTSNQHCLKWPGGLSAIPGCIATFKSRPTNEATEQVQFWYIISENHLSANYHSDNGCSTNLSFVYNVAEQEGKTLPFLRSHCAIPPTLFVGRRIILPTGNWQNQRQNADQILEATWE